jgi:hypothetical protein
MTGGPRPGATDWCPGRGDYGTDHASDMIALVEKLNCVKGCRFAGDAATRAQFGPGGDCGVLGRIWFEPEKGIPELDPQPAGPFCRKRTGDYPPEPLPDQEALFDLEER